MTDGEKGWGIVGSLGALAVWFFKQVLGGEKKKTQTESTKIRAEADDINLDTRIKATDYYKAKWEETLVKLEEVEKLLHELKQQCEQYKKELENTKIELTIEKIKANRK